MKMYRPASTLAAVGVAAIAAVSCSSSSNPAASSSNSSSTASVTVPRPSSPTTNASIRYAEQPVVLAVQNAALTSTSGNTYTFEVATDPAFASKVQTKDNVAEGTGQTTVKLDALAGGKDYYWHARATGGGTTGPFSATAKFTIGAQVTLNAPAPLGPLSGQSTPPRPTFRVANATRTGPAGAVTYLFEISTSSTFTGILLSATRSEGVNETDFTPGSDLPVNTTLFWRATAIDGSNNVTSSPSSVQNFSTRPTSQAEFVAAQLGVVLWPGAQPGGTFGHATMGNDPNFGVGWGIQTLHYWPQDVYFQSPDVEMLRYFDLFDRGYDPDGAIGWMKTNGYPTDAVWYPPPEKAVLGLHYVYIASRGKVVTNSIWDIVLRVE